MLRLDKDKREAIAKAKAEIAQIMDPVKAVERKERRQRDREMRKRVGKRAPEQRQPRVRDNTYLQWIRRLPCVCCGSRERVEAAHIRAGYQVEGWRPVGMQEKPDDVRVAPLCALDHREGPDAQHRGNERAWWSARGIEPPDLCAALRRAYENNEDGEAVVRRFAPSRSQGLSGAQRSELTSKHRMTTK